MEYIHLISGASLPVIQTSFPFKMLVLIEDEVSPQWQWNVSCWLVKAGCRFMMAWGRECSAWDDSVDYASLDAQDYQLGRDEDFVLTTWHTDDSISEVFDFCMNSTFHPSLKLSNTVILHIAKCPNMELVAIVENAGKS